MRRANRHAVLLRAGQYNEGQDGAEAPMTQGTEELRGSQTSVGLQQLLVLGNTSTLYNE